MRFDRMFFLTPGISDEPAAGASASSTSRRGKAGAKASKAPGEPHLVPRREQPEMAQGWRPTSLLLVGRRRIPGFGRFPSDHWGVLTAWQVGGAAGSAAVADKAGKVVIDLESS
mmetsp:Transcript_72816/g.236562  ORF Transcript_72816/g.236562 Transcript_72816/m.236562 type:complete len:114 (-) Transcript_72816:76-417(-)